MRILISTPVKAGRRELVYEKNINNYIHYCVFAGDRGIGDSLFYKAD